jgi:hypothetical protein
MEKKEYRYEIDGKIYIQRPLVLGQTSQMIETFADINIPSDVDTIGIIKLLGDKLPDALAVVLREENIALKDKDISTLAEINEYPNGHGGDRQFFRLEPDSFRLREVDRDDGADTAAQDDETDWIEKVVIALSRGDITKREQILWGYTLKECKPWLEECGRWRIFREGVIGYLGVGGDGFGEKCNELKKARCKLEYGDLFEWTCKNCKDINDV